MKDKIMKIIYFVTAFMVAGAIILNGVTAPVMAATEIESLPRVDIDVSLSYDSDNLYLNYEDNLYTLPFSQKLKNDSKWLVYNTSSGGYYYNFSGWTNFVPEYTDKESDDLIPPLSMWFSPSEMRVYMFTGTNTSYNDYGQRGAIKSCYGSTFIFDNCQSYVALNYYDLADMSFNILGLISLEGKNGESLCGAYPQMYTNKTGGVNKYYNGTASVLFPNDLICVYSNTEISGFYEFDVNSNTIYTPDYYFRYQYLFYVEGVGYTFIDSARPLVDIIDNSDTYAYLDFSEVCNRRIWTSVDGVGWTYVNLVSSMYGDWQQISYEWFFDNVGGNFVAKLVYTTDLDYGVEPILPPEFLEEYFSSEVFDVEQIIYLLDYSVNYPKGEVPEADKDWFEVLVYATQSFKGDVVSFYRYYKSLQDDSLVKEFTNFLEQQTILNSFSDDYVFEYVFHDDGTYTPVHKVSLYGFVKLMNKSLINIDTDLNNMQLNLHNDLKSVFDNISLTNTYMESIDAAVKDLPDYTKQFNESIGVQKDILEALEKLESSPGTSAPGTSDTVINSNFDMVVFENWMNELDKSIDTIAKVEVFDEITDSTDIVGDVVDDVFDEVFDFEKAPELSQGADEVSGMISGAIGQLSTGSMLIGAFDYASNITSGVGFINANVNNFYEASSVMKPVFLSGAAMFVVNLVLRRKE